MTPPRFRLRTLMVVVAGIALLMGGVIEWSNYQRWAVEDDHERLYLVYAAEYDREAANCRVKAANKEPYVAFLLRQQHIGMWTRLVPPPRLPPGTEASALWAEEAAFHNEDATRRRTHAAEHHQKKMEYQRFWFPWIAD